MYPMIDLLNENNLTNISIEDIISNLIDSFVNNHTISKKAHEELMAMTHLDEDVAAIFKESEFKLTSKIEQKLIENNIVLENARERIHLIIGIVENMSYFECPDCNKKHYIYGESKIDEIAKELQIPVLAKLPIDPKVAECYDAGLMETVNTDAVADVIAAVEKL